jgi:hypothetical protein
VHLCILPAGRRWCAPQATRRSPRSSVRTTTMRPSPAQAATGGRLRRRGAKGTKLLRIARAPPGQSPVKQTEHWRMRPDVPFFESTAASRDIHDVLGQVAMARARDGRRGAMVFHNFGDPGSVEFICNVGSSRSESVTLAARQGSTGSTSLLRRRRLLRIARPRRCVGRDLRCSVPASAWTNAGDCVHRCACARDISSISRL